MKKQLNLSPEFIATREKLLELLYWIVLVCMWVAISASVWRGLEMGIRSSLYFQIFLVISYLLVFILRRKFSYKARIYIIISILFLLATGGIHTFGLYSQSTMFFLISTVLAFIFLDFKHGMIVFLLSFSMLVLSGYFFCNQIIVFTPPVNNFNTLSYAWVMSIVVFVIITFVISLFGFRLYAHLIKNTNRLVEQEENLNRVNKMLHKEIEARTQAEDLLKHQFSESKTLNEEYQQLNQELHVMNDLLQKSNAQLTEAKEKAQAADKLKTAFLSNMSHEIRTPMNAIIGFTTLLNVDEISSEDSKRYINIIQSSSNNLLNIISDIVTMSKIESGQLTLYPETFELNKFVDEFLEKYTAEVFIQKDNNVMLEVNALVPDPCDVIVDKDCLRQIVSKLIENAIKFTYFGKIEVDFTLVNHEELEISIKDTGIGISDKDKKVIFDIFNQADGSNTRKYGGVGLGLSITKGLLTLLNGQIQVISSEGSGSTFLVRIPIVIANVGTESYIDTLPKFSNKNILVIGKGVWDNVQINRALQLSNATLNYIELGYQAIEYCIENSNIDLIFLSSELRDTHWIDLNESIKKINKNIPIVLCASSNIDSELLNNVSLDAALKSPIGDDIIVEILEKYLSKE